MPRGVGELQESIIVEGSKMKGIGEMPTVATVIVSILFVIAFLAVAIIFIANSLFRQKVKREVKKLFNNYVENKKQIVRKADLEGLPLCVQKWLEYSQVVGKERIRTVRLKQIGAMRTKDGQPWMPAEAEQYFTIDEPGFIWKAKIKVNSILHIAGRDKYQDGKGNMLIKFLSVINVANARGMEMDQGALLRYLAETVWFPTAALSPYIKWEEIDSKSAKATISYKGVTASGVFLFNDQGEVVNFVTERYMEVKGRFVLETWSTPMKDYKEFSGIKIPAKGEVIWRLKTGDFSWYQVQLKEIEYNRPVVY